MRNYAHIRSLPCNNRSPRCRYSSQETSEALIPLLCVHPQCYSAIFFRLRRLEDRRAAARRQERYLRRERRHWIRRLPGVQPDGVRAHLCPWSHRSPHRRRQDEVRAGG
ncbi:hypothetical protein [Chroococcidiopsis sp. SAG 2025]|uniref:hypothetical protein n=1 Tax=Chroococcidiopsis sp. SAG 2025 TaxID=171389 RepID=UPI002936F8AF|nr:hypothetical protein [Chroococcidiopsis sp. SAG 2025]